MYGVLMMREPVRIRDVLKALLSPADTSSMLQQQQQLPSNAGPAQARWSSGLSVPSGCCVRLHWVLPLLPSLGLSPAQLSGVPLYSPIMLSKIGTVRAIACRSAGAGCCMQGCLGWVLPELLFELTVIPQHCPACQCLKLLSEPFARTSSVMLTHCAQYLAAPSAVEHSKASGPASLEERAGAPTRQQSL